MSCTGNPAVGVYAKLLIEPGASPHTFDDDSERYEILPEGIAAENMQKHGRLVGGQGITGLVYPIKTRVRTGGYYVFGQFKLNPSPGYLDTLLPHIFGKELTHVFSPDTCPVAFGMLIHRDKEAWEYLDCKVASWELRGRAPGFREQNTPDLLVLTINVIGKTETKGTTWPDPEPSMPQGDSFYPLIIQDSASAFKLNSTAREIYEFRLLHDRGLQWRGTNALTVNQVFSTKRRTTLDVRLPWSAANDDLYDMDYAGAAAQLKFAYTTGGKEYYSQFDITNFKAPPESPFVKDENEVAFTLSGEAYGDATTNEMTITNINAP
jgi:hypothetical protein